MLGGIENRLERRFPVGLSALMKNEIIEIENISLNGLKLKSEVQLSISENKTMYLFLHANKVIKLVGDIKWSNKVNDKEYCCGFYINHADSFYDLDYLALLTGKQNPFI